MTGEITIERKRIYVRFPYRAELVGKVREIADLHNVHRPFNDVTKAWSLPLSAALDVHRQFREFIAPPEFGELVSEQVIEEAERLEREETTRTAIDANLELLREALPKGWRLLSHQIEGAEWLAKKRFGILADDMGVGKCLANSEVIPTPTGWKKMGDLQVGDHVFGSDGMPTSIIGVYTQGVKPIYRMTFSDGTFSDCGLEHIWSVKDANAKRRATKDGSDGRRSLTTAEIINRGLIDRGQPKFWIPTCKPIDWTRRSFTVEPYFAGVILGDGCISGSFITIGDPEIMDFLPKPISVRKRVGCSDHYYGTSESKKWNACGLVGKSPQKRIPDQYLKGSIAQRLDLLQGLMDTDGSCCQNRTIFHTRSTGLAEDVRELVNSLGGIATIHSYDRVGGRGTDIAVRISIPICPFRIVRKASQWRKPIKNRVKKRAIVSIEYNRDEEATCIAVDAQDRLYLTTRNYIVTHNTIQSLAAAKVIRQAIGSATVCIVPANKVTDWKEESEQVGIVPFIHSWAKLPDPEKVPTPFVLIGDEAHYAQNLKSKRTGTFLELARRADAVMCLTGTPMRGKKAINLFPLLKAIRHPLARNRTKYEQRYCGAREAKWCRWVADSATNLPELRDLVRPYLKRRLKKDCLDLPAKTRVMVNCDIPKDGQREFLDTCARLKSDYELRKKRKMADLENQAAIERWDPMKLANQKRLIESADAAACLGQIRMAASLAKVATAVEMAEDIVEADSQVLVFTEFRETAIAVAKHFGTVAFIGGLSHDTQDRLKREFQNSTTKVLAGTIAALGTGHNLTAANNVILLDRPLTPGDAEQAEDRAYRIGTKWPVTTHWLRAFKVCYAIDELLEVKQGVIDIVINGHEKKDVDVGGGKLSPERILGLIFLEGK